MGRDSSVGIATWYRLDVAGIESRWGPRFSTTVQINPGFHPASGTMGAGSFPGIKQPGFGVDHPPHLAPRLNIKNRDIYLLLPRPLWLVIGNFTFTFTSTTDVLAG